MYESTRLQLRDTWVSAHGLSFIRLQDVPALLYTGHHASALDSLSSCDVDNPADLQQQQQDQQEQQHQLGQDMQDSAAGEPVCQPCVRARGSRTVPRP